MAKKNDSIKTVTKPGIAKWPHLVTARTLFKPEGEYTTSLLFDSDEFDSMELKAIVTEMVDKFYQETIDGLKPATAKKVEKIYPWSEEEDEDGTLTGMVELKFKCAAQYENKKGEIVKMKPKIFDGAGNLIKRKINIGSGTVMCIATTIKPYYMSSNKAAGATFYVNAVQIRKLVEYGADAEGMGFETDGDAIVQDTEETMASYSEGSVQTPEAGEGDF